MKQIEIAGICINNPQKLTQKLLKTLLHYDPETGVFRWNLTRRGVCRGQVAGSVHSTGYRCISLQRRSYRAGRLAFFYMKGRWPDPQIDHINRIRDDDRWSNLREVTQAENNSNKAGANPAGYIGVEIRRGMYRARIQRNGFKIDLGTYETPEEASQAYSEASTIFEENQ